MKLINKILIIVLFLGALSTAMGCSDTNIGSIGDDTVRETISNESDEGNQEVKPASSVADEISESYFDDSDRNLSITDSLGLEFESRGDGTAVLIGIGECTDTEIIIPSVTLEGDLVTEIGDYAFYSNPYTTSYITSVIIPEGVISIGEFAFGGCDNLSSVILPSGLVTIGPMAFSECSCIETIDIPSSVNYIGGGAFNQCSALTSISIPEGITELPYYTEPYHEVNKHGMFGGCSNLVNVELPDSLTSIGILAFSHCGVENIVIPDGVTIIESGAFCDCDNLISVELPETVTVIMGGAFMGCNNMQSIYIPDSIEEIGTNAFSECDQLLINGIEPYVWAADHGFVNWGEDGIL